MPGTIVLQSPQKSTHLFLLFHGVNATPESLHPIATMLARSYLHAAIVLVQAPYASDFGQGYQWFSVQGVTEQNRTQRVEMAMPAFVETVRNWQKKTGVNTEQTTLIGFSQGAIMALSSTQMVEDVLAARIVALSGRFATLPKKGVDQTQIHFIHGDQDNVIDHRISRIAHEALLARGVMTTYDLIPHLAHSVDQTAIMSLFQRLSDGK